jgi:hypothetical protein
MDAERIDPPSPEDAARVWDGEERRVARRRVKRRYRFFERRHGFDRRKRYPVLGFLRDRGWLVLLIILLINALSFLDGYFTAAELGLGIAREGNPLLAAADRQGPLVAIAVKFGAMAVISTTVWFGRKRRSVLALALVAVAVFAGLVLLHYRTLHGLGLI